MISPGARSRYDPPDDAHNFPAGQCLFTLDNRSGRWAGYNARRLTDRLRPRYAGVDLGDEAAGPGAWWLFAGRVARWDERSGDVIEVKCFDALSDLAQTVGTFTPGVADETPGPRLTAITAAAAAAANYRTRYATGTVHLTRQPTDRAPLEEAQIVAGSDGGMLLRRR